jgi:hypothetical protein
VEALSKLLVEVRTDGWTEPILLAIVCANASVNVALCRRAEDDSGFYCEPVMHANPLIEAPVAALLMDQKGGDRLHADKVGSSGGLALAAYCAELDDSPLHGVSHVPGLHVAEPALAGE